MKLGVLHPGAMGISLAATAQNTGCQVWWASESRSTETKNRAEKYNLREAKTVEDLCQECDALLSICPPHAAESVADEVLSWGFKGLYLDANAIAPERVYRIEKKFLEAGTVFIDGGVIGGPAWEPGKTWLYLSGEAAEQAAAWFSAGPLETSILGNSIGQASALKMCYAAYSKGTTALLCGVLAAADELGVRDALETQWSRGGSDFSMQAQKRVQQVTLKAWRFSGEMAEIARTFEIAGLPGGFHQAAEEIYLRMAHFKDELEIPSLGAVLEALVNFGET